METSKIIECSACKKSISSQARECPHCGHPLKNEERSWLGKLPLPVQIIAGLGIVAAFIFGMKPLMAGLREADKRETAAETKPEPKLEVGGGINPQNGLSYIRIQNRGEAIRIVRIVINRRVGESMCDIKPHSSAEPKANGYDLKMGDVFLDQTCADPLDVDITTDHGDISYHTH